MRLNKRTSVLAASVAAVLTIAAGGYLVKYSAASPKSGLCLAQAGAAPEQTATAKDSIRPAGDPSPSAKSVELGDEQLKSVKVEPVGEHVFAIRREAVGGIGFNNDMTVQVFPPYPGKIIQTFAKLGDEVAKGQKLFTIDSPDLTEAESTLIASAGTRELTTRALARARQLYETQGIAQKDLEQAVSEQQSAEGAFKAARNALHIFGKSEAEIDRIVAERRIDPAMVVPSPITGRITDRNAQPGLFVQPGTAPAPYSVADLSTMWMLAYVAESDTPLFHVGQEVKVKVMAYPDRVFEGKVSTIGATVDPNTHRLSIRSEIRDPKHELRPGMFATFVIRTGDDVRAMAVPLSGVVREGDGTMTVWVATGNRVFVKRTVKVGLQQDGYDQIVEGLRPGESVATDGALFLSNALTNSSR